MPPTFKKICCIRGEPRKWNINININFQFFYSTKYETRNLYFFKYRWSWLIWSFVLTTPNFKYDSFFSTRTGLNSRTVCLPPGRQYQQPCQSLPSPTLKPSRRKLLAAPMAPFVRQSSRGGKIGRENASIGDVPRQRRLNNSPVSTPRHASNGGIIASRDGSGPNYFFVR